MTDLPALELDPWEQAKDTLHLWCQIVGKAKPTVRRIASMVQSLRLREIDSIESFLWTAWFATTAPRQVRQLSRKNWARLAVSNGKVYHW